MNLKTIFLNNDIEQKVYTNAEAHEKYFIGFNGINRINALRILRNSNPGTDRER